jgi:hypothetical protein
MATSSNYTNVLWATRKNLVNTINLNAPLWSRIKNKNAKGVRKSADNRWYVEFPVNTSIGDYSRWVTEGGSSPTASSSPCDLAKVSLKTLLSTLQITGEQNDLGEITGDTTMLSNEAEKVALDHAHKIEIALWSDGTGCISTTSNSGSSSTSMTVTSTRFLREGMIIDVYTALSGGSQKVNSVTISAISGKTLTLSAASTWAAGEYIFPEDTRGLTPPGLLALINDNATIQSVSGVNDWFVTGGTTSYHGLSRGSYSAWSSTVKRHATPGTVRTLTEALMNSVIHNMKIRHQDTRKINAIYCDPGMAHTIQGVCPQQVFRSDLQKELGLKNPIYFHNYQDMTSIEVVPMVTAPPHTIIFVAEPDLEIKWTGEPTWVPNANGQLVISQLNMPSGSDVYKGTLRTRANFFGKNPAVHGILTDISYASGYEAL